MGGNGKHRWKISFHRSNSSSAKQPPKEFICPISGSLMSDPVIVASGQTFERLSVQVCREFGYSPELPDGTRPDFSNLIPNMAIKTTILNWCDHNHADRPQPPDLAAVEKNVRTLMEESRVDEGIRVSEMELLKGVADRPPIMFSHANTELGRGRVDHFYSSSSEESVVVASGSGSPYTPLPFATRPSCYSSSSPSSSEIVEVPALNLNSDSNSINSSPEEAELMTQLSSSVIVEQEEAVISLRKLTRTEEDLRVSLCSTRLLSALRSLIVSRYNTVQVNAVASLVNLSLEKPNKVKIVRSGFVPPLVDVLKSGCSESQEHAAGALFSLALEEDNKMAIGVLGALPPLMHALIRAESERTRHDSALALYHLTLVESNRVKLVKLNSVPTLLALSKAPGTAGRVLLILCNLAVCGEGRSAMLDANAVECLVGMLRRNELDSESTRENCVAALYALSHGSMRFRGLAREAKAVEVLSEVEKRGSERAREKAKRLLMILRGGGGGRPEEGVLDWEGVLDSGTGAVLGGTRYRVGPGRSLNAANSTTF
ncbi:U-box domain-containing protein 38-like [Argentina anserina]|uniref:U-box domain-containing protein 38-like n=1 Tax=Argentina anserina TaxID=57926 RepID=UPI0021767576|nr:U-box domain-containing protein 38-like [Potentilla anserina]